MKVLSLFGWIEAGRVALDKLGIVPESYHSAEFDKYPASVSAHNYPDIVHIGSVTEVDGHDYEGVDLLIGWPPCQDLSIAGKRAGLEGSRSSLFWEYVRILNEAKPKFFLVENVASMPKDAKQVMTEALFGIEPVLINSALVSAQNRKRLYWVGKRNEDGTYSKVDVPQPEDRWIVLKDILEDIPLTDERWKPLDEKYVGKVKERIEKFRTDKKSLAVISEYGTVGFAWHLKSNGTAILSNDKSFGITATYAWACPRDDFDKSNRTVVVGQYRRTDLRVHADQDNAPTLTANMGTGGNNVPVVIEPYCLNPQIEWKQPSLADRIYHDEAKGTAVTTCFVTNVLQMSEFSKNVLDENGICAGKIQWRRINEDGKREDYNKDVPMIHRFETRENDGKTWTLTTFDKDNVIWIATKQNVVRIPEATKLGYVELGDGECVDIAQPNSKTRRGRAMIDKANALTKSPQFMTLKYEEPKYYWRKLTVRECARLQTFPDTFSFDAVSNSRAYKGIGNSWTVDVIAHIFSQFLK